MACYRLAAVRITQPGNSAIEDACHSQTSFVDEVLDVPGVNERVFLQALAKLLELPWWEADSDQPQNRSLRRYLPADVALKNRLLAISIDTKPSENAAQAIDEASAVEATALHTATSDPLSLVASQQLAASVTLTVVWHVGARASTAEDLQKLYGLGADTLEKSCLVAWIGARRTWLTK